MHFIVYLISINILGFLLILIDKKKAIRHKWRIAESILLFTSIIGGCFGMFISMYLCHHKTKKLKFKLIPVICVIWILALYRLYIF